MNGIVPPHDKDLEEILLGTILIESSAMNDVMARIKTPDVFYVPKNKSIWKAAVTLYTEGQPIDLMTITQECKKSKYEGKPDAHYITSLTSRVNSAANVEQHCLILIELYMRREAYRYAHRMLNESYDLDKDVFNVLDDIESGFFELRGQFLNTSYSSISEAGAKYMKELEQRIALSEKGEMQGVPSGIMSIDRVTGGWEAPDLVIIAARPGQGKTALTLSMLRNSSVDFKKPVAIFSLEMSKSQLVQRLITAETSIVHDKFKKGNISESEMQQIVQKTGRLFSSKIFIDDTPGISLMELKAKARKLKNSEDIQLIAVDYLQLMSGNGSKHGNREQEVSQISRGLKEMAKELHVPVIALSQLSRAVETRGGDKRPQLSDLRESGSIEQDADMVAFIFRPEYYGITEGENGEDLRGLGELIIAKHRSGALETVPMKFIGKYIKYTDVNDMDQPSRQDPMDQRVESLEYAPMVPDLNSFENEGKSNDDEAPF